MPLSKSLAQHFKFAEVTEIRVKKMSKTAVPDRMLHQDNVTPTSASIPTWFFFSV